MYLHTCVYIYTYLLGKHIHMFFIYIVLDNLFIIIWFFHDFDLVKFTNAYVHLYATVSEVLISIQQP